MRSSRTLMPLMIVVALTAIAAVAPHASADLEVTREVTGNPHCPLVQPPVTYGCLTHTNGEFETRKHVFGIESHITRCKSEYWSRGDEKNVGVTLEKTNTSEPSGDTCTRQPCTTGGVTNESPFTGTEGTPPADAEMGSTIEYETTTLCFEPIGGGADESCEIDIGYNETEAASHVYEFGHAEPGASGPEMPSHGISGFRCEIVGHWLTESGGYLHNDPTKQKEDVVEIQHV